MFAAHEIALLIAVVTPIAIIAAIDVYLALNGEAETLLLPRILRYPSVELDREAAPEPAFEIVEDEREDAALRKAA